MNQNRKQIKINKGIQKKQKQKKKLKDS